MNIADEGVATLHTLRTVQPFLSTAPHLAPHFLLEHETLQPTTRVVIFLKLGCIWAEAGHILRADGTGHAKQPGGTSPRLSTGAFFQPFFMKARRQYCIQEGPRSVISKQAMSDVRCFS